MADVYEDIGPVARKHLRRNFSLGVMNGTAFRFAETMMDATLVLTWFLSQLGASSLLIGLVSPIRSGGWFLPQILVSGYVQRRERKMPLYWLCGGVRVLAIVLLAVSIWLVGDNRALLIAIFFVCLALLSLGEGFSGPSFMDIVAKAIPSRRRGSFFAWRNFMGGIVALSSGLAVRYILDEGSHLAFPTNFGILFALAAAGFVLSVLSFSSVIEPLEKTDGTALPFTHQLKRALGFVRQDRNYRQLILVRSLLVLGGGLSAPFYIVYGREVLNAPARSVGNYLLSFTLASIAANVVWGRLSTRHGNKKVIVGSALLGLCIPVSALLAGYAGSLQLFYLPFILRGVYESSIMIGHVSFVLDIAPAAQRPTYVGLINTVLGLASFVLMTSGIIVAITGYEVLFLITTGFFVAGLIASLGLHDPVVQA